MHSLRVEDESPGVQVLGRQANASSHPPRQGGCDLVNPDFQGILVPCHRTWADLKMRLVAADLLALSFGKAPDPPSWPIQGHIERTMVHRIGHAMSSCAGIPGRKHAADKRDHGQGVAAVIAEGIEIPPCVAAGRDRSVEAWRIDRSAWDGSRQGPAREGVRAHPTILRKQLSKNIDILR